MAASSLMNEPAPLPAAPASPPPLPADVVFAALSDPSRVRILAGLFDGQFHPAPALGGTLPKHRDLTRKHAAVLVKAGLLVAEPDPQDQRRQHYKLAPSIKTETTPQGRVMDFGSCLVRF